MRTENWRGPGLAQGHPNQESPVVRTAEPETRDHRLERNVGQCCCLPCLRRRIAHAGTAGLGSSAVRTDDDAALFLCGGGRYRLEELLLAVNQRVGVVSGNLETVAVGDGVTRAGFYAIATEDAAVVIDDRPWHNAPPR